MARSLMGLLPSRAIAVNAGSVLFQADQAAPRDLLQMPEKQLRRLRGPAMAMIFQDPMTALNPVLRLSVQLTESVRQHLGLDRQLVSLMPASALTSSRINSPAVCGSALSSPLHWPAIPHC